MEDKLLRFSMFGEEDPEASSSQKASKTSNKLESYDFNSFIDSFSLPEINVLEKHLSGSYVPSSPTNVKVDYKNPPKELKKALELTPFTGEIAEMEVPEEEIATSEVVEILGAGDVDEIKAWTGVYNFKEKFENFKNLIRVLQSTEAKLKEKSLKINIVMEALAQETTHISKRSRQEDNGKKETTRSNKPGTSRESSQ